MPDTTDNYQRTFHGNNFHVNGDDPGEIDIRDIAHALARVNRFNGHTSRPYSVAEHSILVMDIVRHLYGSDPHLEMAALMHDASEAYLSDISSPFKAVLPDYKALEERVMRRIADKYDIGIDVFHHKVKNADWIALFAEGLELQPRGNHREWAGWTQHGELGRDYRKKFGVPWYTPAQATKYFLREFYRLKTEIQPESVYKVRRQFANI